MLNQHQMSLVLLRSNPTLVQKPLWTVLLGNSKNLRHKDNQTILCVRPDDLDFIIALSVDLSHRVLHIFISQLTLSIILSTHSCLQQTNLYFNRIQIPPTVLNIIYQSNPKFSINFLLSSELLSFPFSSNSHFPLFVKVQTAANLQAYYPRENYFLNYFLILCK